MQQDRHQSEDEHQRTIQLTCNLLHRKYTLSEDWTRTGPGLDQDWDQNLDLSLGLTGVYELYFMNKHVDSKTADI